MRIVFLLTALVFLYSCKQEVGLPKLNHQNIKYLSMKGMTEANLIELSEKILDQKKIFNPELLVGEVDVDLKHIRQELNAQLDAHPVLFEYSKKITQAQISHKNKTINLASPFKYEQLVISQTEIDYIFPPYLYLLLANLDQLYAIPLDKIKGFEKNSHNLYVTYQIEIVEPQHMKYMQAIVKELNVYSGKNGKVVFTFKESRESNAIVKDRLLPDGYSLDLVPVHSFSFFGQRILDPFYDYNSNKKFCQNNQPQLNHQVISCNFNFYEGDKGKIDLNVTVIGGRNAIVKLVAEGEIPEEIQEKTLKRIKKDLNLSANFFKDANAIPTKSKRELSLKSVSDEMIEWDSFGVNIVFNRKNFGVNDKEKRVLIKLTGKAWLDYKNKQSQE